jgi:hypothetical protein
MCHELDEFYWSYRAEQAHKEMEKAKEKKQPAAPAKPAPESEPETREPVPA